MNLNQQFTLIRQSPTVALTDRITILKASGHAIIPLQVGDPDIRTHPSVMDEAIKALQSGLTHYAPSRGTPDLLQAIASKLIRDNGLTYDPASEILVTHGGIHAYYLALQSILNPGDEVLIPDPTWATHANMVTMLSGTVVRVPASAENGFIPPLDSWGNYLTSKTRVIVLNYPSNPTGVYPTREYLLNLQDFAAANNLWMVSDEVYENLYYGEKPTSVGAFPSVKERTILVFSLSKTYAMTGWRVGYLAGPSQVIDNALKASQNSITCVAPFIQKGAVFALTNSTVQASAVEMRTTYSSRRDLVMQIATQYKSGKVAVIPPKGAFYFFLDFRFLGLSSIEICERLLDETGVGLVPGSAFGLQGNGFVRMSTTVSAGELEVGFRKIMEWVEKQ
jgi:aspartate/methionine/tyrosine aminotransferase